MQQHLLTAQHNTINILNWQVYHMCIHIKIKSPPAILPQRGVCVQGRKGNNAAIPAENSLKTQREKQKTNYQTLRITIKKKK